MRILIAEDEATSRCLLERSLLRWGHAVVVVADGIGAWEELQKEDAPSLVIIDWMMPGLDGVEICRRARGRSPARPLYILLLTARDASEDIAEALDAGADDYVTKPFAAAELKARVGVGVRVVQLQHDLARQITDLEQAIAHVDELHGILPVCSYCKRIRSDTDSWHQMEAYISAHSAVRFSHGVCPECVETVLRPQLQALRRTGRS